MSEKEEGNGVSKRRKRKRRNLPDNHTDNATRIDPNNGRIDASDMFKGAEEGEGEEGVLGSPQAARCLSDIQDTFETINDNPYTDPETGRFKAGNPGRPFGDRERSSDAEGDGDTEEVDLFRAFHRALKKFGPEKFCLQLLKNSPVSASQLLANLSKSSSALRTNSTERQITIITSLPPPNTLGDQLKTVLSSDTSAGEGDTGIGVEHTAPSDRGSPDPVHYDFKPAQSDMDRLQSDLSDRAALRRLRYPPDPQGGPGGPSTAGGIVDVDGESRGWTDVSGKKGMW